MKIQDFINIIGADYYTGVPDSLLRPLCDYLMDTYGEDPRHHVIAANEGNAVGLAAGYHLATGAVPVVYMQNSGEGNSVNPIASLLNEQVYGIPVIFVIGWRGEPGIKDEPQHAFQGEITVSLMKELEVKTFVVTGDTTIEDLAAVMDHFNTALKNGHQAAFIIEKDALCNDSKHVYENHHTILREEAIKAVVAASGCDLVVATTGKAGRELFEIREFLGHSHDKDFLTVGSMGHASSIALGIASQKQDLKIWCIDGDGAAIMHMGAMAIIGKAAPDNFIHILINNGAHESVGGIPTAGDGVDFIEIAKACGYKSLYRIKEADSLSPILSKIKEEKGPVLVEILCAIGSRKDLGRPTIKPRENMKDFIRGLL